MKRETKQAFVVALILIGLLGAIKYVSNISSMARDIGFTVAFLFQILVPIWLIERNKEHLYQYKIGFLDFKSLKLQPILLDLRRAIVLCAIVFPPYWLAFHLMNSGFQGTVPVDPNFSWLNFVLTQFLIVALSEEVFYRGFLQTRLLQQWPNQKFIFGIPVGAAVIITSVLFAVGHFIGEYQIGRLGPFFPAFLFSYLAFRSKSVLGAVAFHALCNIFGQLLFVYYFWK